MLNNFKIQPYFIYSKWWRYIEYWGPSWIDDLASYWPEVGNSSTFLSVNLFPIVAPCDSWGRFRSHWRKVNHRFTYSNGKIQICDLLFSCASWVLLRKHTGPAPTSFSFVAADVPGQMDKVVVSQTAGSTQEWIYCISITYYIMLNFNTKLMLTYQYIKESSRINWDSKCRRKYNYKRMISTHIWEFFVLNIACSFHKQSKEELMKVFC